MTALRPFWRYYGGKWRNAPHYPPPEHDIIVEPFAGAAGYALRYPDRRVILVDSNPIIAGIWRYLIRASSSEILALPDLPDGGTTDDCDMPQEARWLAGFWLNPANGTPRLRASSWAKQYPADGTARHWCGWGHLTRQRIASQVDAIRHWQIIEGDYTDAPDVEATWMVDPPYSEPAGRYYPAKVADYSTLGEWCRTRRGLAIVCEQEGADWLPFAPLGSFRSAPAHYRPKASAEVIWLNRAPVGWGVQQALPLGRRA